MISVLIPTRNRTVRLYTTVESIRSTAKGDVQIWCYVDADDTESASICVDLNVNFTVEPRICMSEMWSRLAELSTGDILMLCSDDVVFKTEGWDSMVEQAYAEYPDKILLVFGDDGCENGKTFSTLPFVSRRWVDTVGYFTPPGYSGDCADSHLDDVALRIGRHKYLPFVIEHLHPAWQKAPMDATYQEKMDRQGDARKLYNSRWQERVRDAEKLKAEMHG